MAGGSRRRGRATFDCPLLYSLDRCMTLPSRVNGPSARGILNVTGSSPGACPGRRSTGPDTGPSLGRTKTRSAYGRAVGRLGK